MPDQEARPERWWEKYSDLLAIAAMAPIVLYLIFHGDSARGMTAGASGVALIMVAIENWSFKKRLWFCLLMAVLISAHAAIVAYTPWYRDDWTLVNALPIGLSDYLICRVIIALGKRVFEPRAAS